jgi:hypothetical protein
VLDLCAELGVAAAPACIAGVWIVPLLSWYHATWDRELDIPGALAVTKVVPSLRGHSAPCSSMCIPDSRRFILPCPTGIHHVLLGPASCLTIEALHCR